MNISTATLGYPRIGKNRLVEEASGQTQLAARIVYLTLGQVWAHADFGLKTRLWEKVILVFQYMFVATQQLQEDIHEK